LPSMEAIWPTSVG
jgi:hypothetical protein